MPVTIMVSLGLNIALMGAFIIALGLYYSEKRKNNGQMPDM